MTQWEGRRAFLLDEARDDLERGEEVRPCLVAWRGDRPLLVAYLRPYRRGGLVDALVEVLSVAVPLGADRLALSVSGRAWSLRDPVPAVIDGVGDLRQRVVVLEQVDGTSGRIAMETLAVPFRLDDRGRVTWLPPVDGEETISRASTALAASIHHRGRFAAEPDRVRRRALACVAAGHLLALAAPVHDELFAGDAPPVPPQPEPQPARGPDRSAEPRDGQGRVARQKGYLAGHVPAAGPDVPPYDRGRF